MAGIQRFLGAAILFGCAIGLVLVPQRAASQSPQGTNSPSLHEMSLFPHFMRELRRASFPRL